MNPYRYLIGYLIQRDNGFQAGSINIDVPAPIASYTDVTTIERELRNHFADPGLIVMSFSQYSNNPGGGA